MHLKYVHALLRHACIKYQEEANDETNKCNEGTEESSQTSFTRLDIYVLPQNIARFISGCDVERRLPPKAQRLVLSEALPMQKRFPRVVLQATLEAFLVVEHNEGSDANIFHVVHHFLHPVQLLFCFFNGFFGLRQSLCGYLQQLLTSKRVLKHFAFFHAGSVN